MGKGEVVLFNLILFAVVFVSSSSCFCSLNAEAVVPTLGHSPPSTNTTQFCRAPFQYGYCLCFELLARAWLIASNDVIHLKFSCLCLYCWLGIDYAKSHLFAGNPLPSGVI